MYDMTFLTMHPRESEQLFLARITCRGQKRRGNKTLVVEMAFTKLSVHCHLFFKYDFRSL